MSEYNRAAGYIVTGYDVSNYNVSIKAGMVWEVGRRKGPASQHFYLPDKASATPFQKSAYGKSASLQKES